MAKRNNRSILWYDAKGRPRSEPFKITVSQVVRDAAEVNQRETGASAAEVHRLHLLSRAVATREERSAVQVAWRIKHNDFAPLVHVLPTMPNKARYLQVLVDALPTMDRERKSSFEPKPSTLNVVESYYAAVEHLHRKYFPVGEGI